MGESKYGKVLTIILIIVVVGILLLLGFLGFEIFSKYKNQKEAAHALDQFDEALNIVQGSSGSNDVNTNTNVQLPDIESNTTENQNTQQQDETSNRKPIKTQQDGYNVEGKIEIPAINLKYTILEKTTPSSIETSVAIMYSAHGLNKPGNTVIVGHNYRNGDFFGNNDKLKIGDKVYITDNYGTKIKYNIYNIYETSPDDSDFIMRDTNGKREISLSTCTDNSKGRLIIWAIEE